MNSGQCRIDKFGSVTQLWRNFWPVVRAPVVEHTEASLAARLGYSEAPACVIEAGMAEPLLRTFLQDAGFRIHTTNDFDIAVIRLCHVPRMASLVVISIDGFGGIVETIEPLLRLRECAPCLPLILASSEVNGSDLTTERLALCDVTLKTSAGPAALSNALTEAKVNNAIWQARLLKQRQAH